MTSPINNVNASSYTRFGAANNALQQQQLQLQQTLNERAHQMQEQREILKSKRAGADAAWHATALAALLYGVTTIGHIGKKIGNYINPVTPPTPEHSTLLGALGGSNALTEVLGTGLTVLAPVSLLYGLYYFVNGKNRT